ncbi:hypothetical protein [Micromonospora sp. NPDC005113]
MSAARAMGMTAKTSGSRDECTALNYLAMLKAPQELGFGPGTTCWRRLKRWIDAGVFDQLHQILLERLNTGNRIDWSRAAMDGNHIDARKGVSGQARRRSTAQARFPNTI